MLVAVLLALLVLPTSVTGSGVALPAIGRESGASLAALQWVVHGYNLTFASFLLACGSLADRWGRRRAFAGGAAPVHGGVHGECGGGRHPVARHRACSGRGSARRRC
ncbi:MFS transporter [Streptomyces tricolor]|nr:MFS transporter [Streptomyces tricolor]